MKVPLLQSMFIVIGLEYIHGSHCDWSQGAISVRGNKIFERIFSENNWHSHNSSETTTNECPIQNCIDCKGFLLHATCIQDNRYNLRDRKCVKCEINPDNSFPAFVRAIIDVYGPFWYCIDCNPNSLPSHLNGPFWYCTDCDQGFTLSVDGFDCISCRQNIEHCSECYSSGDTIICSICDEEYYSENGTVCQACINAVDNCRVCGFLYEKNSNDSRTLACIECQTSYFLDYYGNCSACNGTIPQCTSCSSFDPCHVFGPVQNLTCQKCEEHYYIGEDKASCQLDCRNISGLCDNCSLDGNICSSCSGGAYLNETSGICTECQKAIPNCMDCFLDSEVRHIQCSSCDDSFALQSESSSCIDCSSIPNCQQCSFAGSLLNCEQCVDGFSIAKPNTCLDCSNVTGHCGRCDEGVCTACKPGFTLTEGFCEETVCGVPPPPPYRGGYAFTGVTYGHMVTYDCECGYALEGEQILTCGDSSKWGKPPCCRKKTIGFSTTSQQFYSQNIDNENVMDFLNSMADTYVHVLNLNGNKLTSIPDLTHFKQLDTLRTLRLWNNRVEQITWENIPPQTETVDLERNHLVQLPIIREYHNCLSIKTLFLLNNKIRKIKIAEIPSTLNHLDLSGNKIKEIGDLSHSKLTTLYLTNTELTFDKIRQFFSLREQKNLKTLYLNRNKLAEMPDTLLAENLESINLRHNNFTHVPDFSQLKKLKNIDLTNNIVFEVLPHFLPENVFFLALSFNVITVVPDLSNFKKLRQLYLSFNNLSTVVPDHLPLNIEILDLRNNEGIVQPNISHLIKLKSFFFDQNRLTLVNANYLPRNLEELSFSRNIISDLPNLSHFDKLILLDLFHNKLTKLRPDYLPVSLEKLYVVHNQITDFPNLSHLKRLRRVDFSDNNLTIVAADHLPESLRQIYLHRNRLSDFPDFSAFKELVSVTISYNNLSAISPDNLPASLQYLDISGNLINDASILGKLTNLEVII